MMVRKLGQLFCDIRKVFYRVWHKSLLFKLKASETPYSIALTDVRRRTKCPLACISCPFLIRRCPFLIRPMRSLLREVRSIQWKVLFIFISRNGHHQKKAPAVCKVAILWHTLCSELMRFLSCTCPVRTR